MPAALPERAATPPRPPPALPDRAAKPPRPRPPPRILVTETALCRVDLGSSPGPPNDPASAAGAAQGQRAAGVYAEADDARYVVDDSPDALLVEDYESSNPYERRPAASRLLARACPADPLTTGPFAQPQPLPRPAARRAVLLTQPGQLLGCGHVNLRRPPADSVTVDGLTFAIRWSRRRRTIGISVGRGGDLRLLAPAGVSPRKLEAAVRAKLPWVRRKLAEFAAQGPPPAAKQFVEGERLPYLGRTYRLVLGGDHALGTSNPDGHQFALRRGRFELAQGLDGAARACVVNWYVARAEARIAARIGHFAPLVGAQPAGVIVRDLGKRRWGFCDGRTRTVSFHWELILLPPAIIDYVVVHELAHLQELNHGRGFWRRVERVLPDCKQRRAWLAAHGQRHVI